MLEMFAKKRGFEHVEDTKLDAYMFLRGKTACPKISISGVSTGQQSDNTVFLAEVSSFHPLKLRCQVNRCCQYIDCFCVCDRLLRRTALAS